MKRHWLGTLPGFDLLLFGYAWADYAALSIFLGPGPRNLLNYAQGDIAGWIRQARATANPTLRQQLVNQAQRAVLEQAIWQPLLTRRITFAVNGACVGAEQQSPYGELLLHDADTAPDTVDRLAMGQQKAHILQSWRRVSCISRNTVGVGALNHRQS